ncbi:MAG TPA: single-stranded DNA-binding protein [Rectinemataceae bacterium]|nr:single-stranded DNA-binding protein [Rectinemataceae bacterium]
MRDINVVVLVGRLTRDSELKYTKSGMPIARFSIAVNRSRKQGEEWVDETSFFEIDFWGKGAEAVNRYLTKGQQVGVEGELRQDRWEQDGQPRNKVVINASNVRLLGNAPSGQGSGGYQKPQQKAAPYEGGAEPRGEASQPSPAVDTFDDDIPF